jgi:hypothetical protein
MGPLPGYSPTQRFGVYTFRSYRVIGLVGSLLHDGSVLYRVQNTRTSMGRRALLGLEIGGFAVILLRVRFRHVKVSNSAKYGCSGQRL